MKKLLGIMVLGLLWVNAGISGENKKLNKFLTKIEIHERFADRLITIPIYIHIIDINEKRYKTSTTHESVKEDVEISNKIWAQANISFEIKTISMVKPNLKDFSENRKWIKKNCATRKKCKGANRQKRNSIYKTLIKYNETKKDDGVNVYYFPDLLQKRYGGSRLEFDFVVISQNCPPGVSKEYCGKNSVIHNSSIILAHELGHVMGHAGHTKVPKELMSIKGGREGVIINWKDAESARTYGATTLANFYNLKF